MGEELERERGGGEGEISEDKIMRVVGEEGEGDKRVVSNFF